MGEEKLEADMRLRQGDYYSKLNASADQQLIQLRYGYEGFPVVVHEQDYFTGPGQVAVSYEVTEKPPTKVGEIKIVGNDVTRDNVILRQVGLYPGQTLTYPELKVAERINLARLNIFRSRSGQGDQADGLGYRSRWAQRMSRDLLVTVQEQPTGSLIFGVGVNSDAGLNGSIALNERSTSTSRNWPKQLRANC